ncbi:MAG: hypothetical protein ABFD66_08725 [Smithella sp.]
MQQVHENVFVGSELDCTTARPGWYVIHACKSPCHQRAVGYRGNLKSDHPRYLFLERGNDLFLNMIDPPKPLFMMETFVTFLRFAHEGWQNRHNILVHCNQGESRAPTLALLFMSKRLDALRSDSYEEAASAFRQIYPSYNPGQGIQTFLQENWHQIR